MSCPTCADVVERPDLVHVIRKCATCGREMRVHEPGPHGRGVQVREGDQVTIPAGFLRMSLNPLKASGHITRHGIHVLAQHFFLSGLPRTDEGYLEFSTKVEQEMDAVASTVLAEAGLDFLNPEHAERITAKLQEDSTSKEYWAFSAGLFLNMAREAIANGQAARAAWASAYAERSRAMVVFKESLEEVVWMAYSVKRLADVLQIWDGHRTNTDEEFWQLTFNENSYVLSQVFAVPLLFIKEKAYVGGMTLERTDSRFVDYLYSAESSREAVLVEIKAPTTPLLGGAYRGNFAPSKDLAGSVVQVLNYRAELSRNLLNLTDKTDVRLSAFSPKCALIVGNGAVELKDDASRRSFELFRASLKDVEIVTYDELFRKVEILAELFRVKRSKPKPA